MDKLYEAYDALFETCEEAGVDSATVKTLRAHVNDLRHRLAIAEREAKIANRALEIAADDLRTMQLDRDTWQSRAEQAEADMEGK